MIRSRTMNPTSRSTCDPRDFQALAFHDAARHFRDGHYTPRAYLDRR